MAVGDVTASSLFMPDSSVRGAWACQLDGVAWGSGWKVGCNVVCWSSGSGHDEKGNERGDCGSGAFGDGVGMLCF